MALARPSRLSARWLVVTSIVLAAGFLLPALHDYFFRKTIMEEVPSSQSAEMKITIQGKEFTVRLAATEAAKTLQRLLPLALEMTELNGNEKYANLAQALPANPQEVRRINAGDMMLWGDDCLVIFYQSFNTPYSYTYLGRILDPDGLAEALGNGSAHVEFK